MNGLQPDPTTGLVTGPSAGSYVSNYVPSFGPVIVQHFSSLAEVQGHSASFTAWSSSGS